MKTVNNNPVLKKNARMMCVTTYANLVNPEDKEIVWSLYDETSLPGKPCYKVRTHEFGYTYYVEDSAIDWKI